MALYYVVAVTGPAASSDAKVGTVPITATKVLTGPNPEAARGLKSARIVEIEAATATKAKEAFLATYGREPVALIAGLTSNVT